MANKDEKLGPEKATTPVGQYYLLDKIAQGGMAEIFKGLAYDLHGIKKTVVIKKILPQIAADPEFINMLINEAKIAVMLSHGNIAQIYDLGKVGDDYFMVMEYVDGRSLSQIHKRSLKLGKFVPVDYACYFISEVASGLNYMHRRSDEHGRNMGIIHRDISPQNVIVCYSGTVKIIDFGIAKAAIQMHITESGVLKGKFAYMSPEQAKGEQIDHRSDIFSLGVILFELLTGKRLFKGKSKKETLQNVRRADVPKLSSIRTDLPPDIDRIVQKALAKDPKRRYMWASELHDDLIKFIYTHYPDFQPSAITQYIRELFREEIEEREELEEDAKTPFLIIDHTQSAILTDEGEDTGIARVPPQLKEFMLDEITPISMIKVPNEKVEKKVKRRPFEPGKFIKKHLKGAAILLSGLVAVSIVLFLIGVKQGIFKLPKFISESMSKTTLIIAVEPKDATVSFGETIIKGEPPYKLKGLKPEQTFHLIVEKDGYSPYFQDILLKSGEKKTLNISLQPEPPHYGKIAITSEPPNATIYFNEKDTNLKTPATLTSIKPGIYHSIGLFLKDYGFWSSDIYLKPDESKPLHAKLVANLGGIEIISDPAGANVFINGHKTGTTPYKKDGLSSGDVLDITVGKDGFTTWKEKAKITTGGTLILRPKLSRTKELMTPHFLRNLDKPQDVPTPEPTNKDTNMLPPAPVN